MNAWGVVRGLRALWGWWRRRRQARRVCRWCEYSEVCARHDPWDCGEVDASWPQMPCPQWKGKEADSWPVGDKP